MSPSAPVGLGANVRASYDARRRYQPYNLVPARAIGLARIALRLGCGAGSRPHLPPFAPVRLLREIPQSAGLLGTGRVMPREAMIRSSAVPRGTALDPASPAMPRPAIP